MTDGLSEAHADLRTPQKNLVVELLEQGGLTVHWEPILNALRESVQGVTEREIADICLELRARRLWAFALWSNGNIMGYLVLQPVNRGSEQMANVYAMAGKKIEMDDWKQYVADVSAILKNAGYSRMVAITTNPRVIEIVKRTGWSIKTYCERVF